MLHLKLKSEVCQIYQIFIILIVIIIIINWSSSSYSQSKSPSAAAAAPRMIFGTLMSYFISLQILGRKVRSPVGKKVDWVEGAFTFYFLSTTIHKNSSQYCIVSLAYPFYRLDWAFSGLQYCYIISFLFWKGLRVWPRYL